jgi:hypothetical protein
MQIADARATVYCEQLNAAADRQPRCRRDGTHNRPHQQLAALCVFELIGRTFGHDDRQLAEQRVAETESMGRVTDAAPRERYCARIADFEATLRYAQPVQNGFHLVTET